MGPLVGHLYPRLVRFALRVRENKETKERNVVWKRAAADSPWNPSDDGRCGRWWKRGSSSFSTRPGPRVFCDSKMQGEGAG